MIQPIQDMFVILKRTLYGLKQAPRAWFDKLILVLESWQFSRAKSNILFFFKRNRSDLIIVMMYVDDIIVTESNNFEIEKFIYNLGNISTLKNLGKPDFFLGIQVIRNKDTLILSQTKYIEDFLVKFDLKNCNGTDTPLVTI